MEQDKWELLAQYLKDKYPQQDDIGLEMARLTHKYALSRSQEHVKEKSLNYGFLSQLFSDFPFNDSENHKFTYIDLFAGIGGFHIAMHNLGGKCVFSSEWDYNAQQTYFNNYGDVPFGDITKESVLNSVPDNFDVLCAGFPCQAFSKAGKQMGFADETKGTLFFQIVQILQNSHPKYIILENVRNLISHDNGNTFNVITSALLELGYNIQEVIMSPHQLGVPQLRERVYILGVRRDIYNGRLSFDIPDRKKQDIDIYSAGIIDESPDPKYNISRHEEEVLTCWNEFYLGIKEKTLGYPIWSSEFKETYDVSALPKWKGDFCLKNRQLYKNNKAFINKWLKKWNNLKDFTPTEQKFEWQAGEAICSIWDGFIQFRPSGIRVKRPDAFPALVAMVQIPIIGRYKRRLTPKEAARLQSFPDEFIPNNNDHQAYKQFGNAVNVNCVKYLAEQLFKYDNSTRQSGYQVHRSEQITPGLNIVLDYDQPLKQGQQICDIFTQALGIPCQIEKHKKSLYYTCNNNGTRDIFLTAAVTSLSHPHPLFKKRIQLKSWFKEVYNQEKEHKNVRVHLIGIYHYDGLVVFVEFNIEDYAKRSWNNSSAHVYTNDIYQAISNGSFSKTDRNGNRITAITGRKFKDHIAGKTEKNTLFDLFAKFNAGFGFGQWITAVQAISEMKQKNFYSWRQAEWAGWLLEYKMQNFIEAEHCENHIKFIASDKSDNLLDFDLYFVEQQFYGDLKASDISKLETPGNDQASVMEAINRGGRLWYIIYEHDTIKDSERNNEMAIKRMELLEKPYDGKGKISYAARMKHSVNFRSMKILELNRANMNAVLKTFNQGHQPSGEDRLPKFTIDKKNIDNYLVFSYKN